MADHSGNVIDLGAYRARRFAVSAPAGVSSSFNPFQNSVFYFWPMMVWMPMPMFVTPLPQQSAL